MTEYKTIDEYVKNFPPEIQTILMELRKTIQRIAPQATEAISYGIPTFKLKGNLVHFAAYKNHVGFYPGAEVMEVFKQELRGYETSKGTIKLPLDKPMPYRLIVKIVKYRVKRQQQLDR